MEILHPDGTWIAEVRSEPPSLDTLKEIVEGPIELISLIHEGEPVQLILNKEGKLKDLPYNPGATALYYESLSTFKPLMGTAVLLRGSAQLTEDEDEGT
jgi:hypothetical protein